MTSTTQKQAKCKPFLKWAGGKKWLSPLTQSLIPSKLENTYYEPFIGAGSFFFSIRPKKSVLSDLNRDLIETYTAIRDHVELVINSLNTYQYNNEFYYYMRSKKPRSLHGKAARFLYLNKTCWNGLYRVNRKGTFNVPIGRYDNPTICNADRLRKASELLRNVQLKCCDFEKAVAHARQSSFVYFDPPYITGHKNNGFHMYNDKLFAWDDQKRLSMLAAKLHNRGVHVLISNADHTNIMELYPDFYLYRISRKSLIGGNGSRRGNITEGLISSYQLDNEFLEEI